MGLRDVTPWGNSKEEFGIEMEGIQTETDRAELLANIRRLATIVLDRLEEGSRERTIDEAQLRLLGNVALRALRLWRQSLATGSHAEDEKRKILAEKQKLEDAVRFSHCQGVGIGSGT